jgi:type II secretory pathway pseudopilin PulG
MREHVGRAASDAGTSLAELLVSVLVFGIVGTIVMVSISVTLGTSRATNARVNNLSGAQVALDAMSKLIQTAAQPPAVEGATPAAAIITAKTNDLKFYGYDNPGAPPAQIEFAVVGDELRETVTPSTNTGPDACMPPYAYGSGVTRVLATGVSAGPVFSYFSQPTAASLAGVALAPGGSGSLSAADLPDVELVGMNLEVGQDSQPKVAGTNAVVTVALPNHLVDPLNVPGSAC